MSNPEIISELSAISKSVAAIPRVNVFSVPTDYFNTLSNSILHTIHTELLFKPVTINLNVGEVPEGYFEGLASQIMNKIRDGKESLAEETKNISMTVSKIGNRNVFTAPEGYFESLSEVINLRIPQPARVISMKKRTSFFKYAAAAVITGLIGLSVFTVLDKKESGHSNKESLAVMEKASEIIKNKTFDLELRNVSDKEIEQFLTESGQDVNAALVASVIDESNLPATDEYLIDDRTLDEYLIKLNLNN
ncbi:MAG TPA: hypothetical protein VK498_01980 [Ferruginibacter sp.]|nr:hypothetical protein [Ferruginibacter sp.]